MVFTTAEAPLLENERPVRPEIWCERPSVAPKMAWSNEGVAVHRVQFGE